jgi:hypothetical protein
MPHTPTKSNMSHILKNVSNIICFLAFYAAFVRFNALFYMGRGGWNDLEWLGKSGPMAVPNISSGFDALLCSPYWILGNMLILMGFLYFEFRVLDLLDRRFKLRKLLSD